MSQFFASINGLQIVALLFFSALAIAYRSAHPAGSMGLGLDANGNTVYETSWSRLELPALLSEDEKAAAPSK